jgi:hypothetical protein
MKGMMIVGDRQQMIAAELTNFINVYPGQLNGVPDTTQAYNNLATCLGNVGIVYQQNQQSRENNPGVNGLHIGELLDMLRTLYMFGPGGEQGFKPQKFWQKLETMQEVMQEHQC